MMRKYTHAVLNKWINAGTIARKRTPAPFPGKTPTRIGLSFRCGNKVLFEYTGKPSSAIQKKWYKLLRSITPENTCMFFEYDRKGLIALWVYENWNGTTQKTNKELIAHYHPG